MKLLKEASIYDIDICKFTLPHDGIKLTEKGPIFFGQPQGDEARSHFVISAHCAVGYMGGQKVLFVAKDKLIKKDGNLYSYIKPNLILHYKKYQWLDLKQRIPYKVI